MRQGPAPTWILWVGCCLLLAPACGGSGGQAADVDPDPADVSQDAPPEADASDAEAPAGLDDAVVEEIGPEPDTTASPDGGTAAVEDTVPACPPPTAPTVEAAPGAVAASTRNRLRWKRADVLANDLAGALGLPQPCASAADLSDRLASGLTFTMLAYACDPPIGVELAADDTRVPWGVGEFAPKASTSLNLHRQSLGGYEVFETLVPPAARPVATTVVATERTVMLACIAGTDAAEDDTSELLDVDVALTARTDELSDTERGTLVTALYRRLLARDPLVAERDVVLTLAVDDAGAALTVRDFAVLTCHTLATSSEFLFY